MCQKALGKNGGRPRLETFLSETITINFFSSILIQYFVSVKTNIRPPNRKKTIREPLTYVSFVPL